MRYLITGSYIQYHCRSCRGHLRTCRFTIDVEKPDIVLALKAGEDIIHSQKQGMEIDFMIKAQEHYGAEEYFS